MPLSEKHSRFPAWFKTGILVLWLVSLALRFWGLGRFNTLVFDEVYYVKFAHNYLTQTPFFDGHPPLSKYLIALGIWIGNQLPFGHGSVNGLAGAAYTTWSYRWLNALTGSFIPLVMAGIAYQLTYRHSYALIVGLFAALDGLFLVESRYALNNIYLIIFGLLGFWCLLRSLNSQRSLTSEFWLIMAGIFFGASASVKWNGLWFLLGAYSLWASAWILRLFQRVYPEETESGSTESISAKQELEGSQRSPLQRLTRLKFWQVALYLAVIPALFYRLSWIPHLQYNTTESFWELQRQILEYHERVGSGPKVHPYCSNWFTWLLMIRPVAYFYQVTNKGDPLPTGKSTLSATPDSVIYDVHAIGNPFLWWLSTLAILLVIGVFLQYAITWLITRRKVTELASARWQNLTPALNPTELWLGLFLVVNYGANLVPWIPITRCIFLYHYMGASVFATMALAWLTDRWLHSTLPRLRRMGIGTILLVVLGFIFWMPIYLGLPLSTTGFQLRMWLPSWL